VSDSAVVIAKDVTLAYNGAPVVSGVDLRIERGQMWFLLGANGAGKTTLLRAILGEVKPRAGEMWVCDAYEDRRRLGFVPQRCELNSTLPTTVGEFVSMGLVGLRARRADRAERLAEALEAVGMAGMRRRRYWLLSGGQRQRALLARALIRRPAWLILDEPTNGLDLTASETFLQLLARINREHGLTVIVVTHDLVSAMQYAGHVVLFGGGTVRSGDASAVLTREHLENAFGVPVAVA
jgi:ABC-type Mn2+/Zn2+ transport system ATPase subunit